MIPPQFLTHRITVVIPATVQNGYGDDALSYGQDATRLTDVPALMSQASGSEITDARDAEVGDWLMSTNCLQITGRCQIEYGGLTLTIVGPVDVVEDEARRPATYARCRAVTG